MDLSIHATWTIRLTASHFFQFLQPGHSLIHRKVYDSGPILYIYIVLVLSFRVGRFMISMMMFLEVPLRRIHRRGSRRPVGPQGSDWQPSEGSAPGPREPRTVGRPWDRWSSRSDRTG